jgi:hypothetical protein
MAERCRLLAEGADAFTKKRLLDLALKYEARSNGRSLATQRLVAMSGQNNSHHRNGGGELG